MTVDYFTYKGYKITGIVHVGMNVGQEIPIYRSLGINRIMGFEPLPEAYNQLAANYPEYAFWQAGLGAKAERRTLHVTATADGQSSSVYDPGVESGYPATEIIKEEIPITIVRFDDLVYSTGIDLLGYNTMVIDVQGMELEVLKGLGNFLKVFDFYIIECSPTAIYKGGATLEQVASLMKEHGYRQQNKVKTLVDDVAFIRRLK